MPVSIKDLSKILSEKLGEKVQIVKIKRTGGGYEAESYILTSSKNKKFFLKRVRRDIHYRLRPEESVYWLMLSNKMMRFSPASDDGFGVFIQNRDNLVHLPELNENSEIFHLQKYEELSGINYWETLKDRTKFKKVSAADLEETKKLAELLSKIHHKPKGLDNNARKKVYNESLHSVFTAQDLFFFFLHSFDRSHSVFPVEKHGKYLSEMIKLFHQFKNKEGRLRHLHGDFWGTNVYCRKDGSWCAVDYSRVFWGEPGIDVAFWMAQYLWLYHETDNKYFRDLGEEFLNHYEKVSGDREIRIFLSFPLGLVGLIYISPYLYPKRTGKEAKSFLKAVSNSVKKGKFVWK